MEKNWKDYDDESCPNCGGALEVLSESPASEDTELVKHYADGDDIRCNELCGFESCLSVENGEAWVQDGNLAELPESETN